MEEKQCLSYRQLCWATGVVLAYFAARLVYCALVVAPTVPPDEVTHAGLCRIFSTALLLPGNSPASYEFGLVTNTPWLYYWLMGKLLHLNFTGIPDVTFLRILNIPMAFGTAWYSLRMLRLLADNRLAHLLLVVVITNIPMFSLLSASVSYDNLTNLLAAMSIYYMLAFIKYRSGYLLAFSILCQLAGCLTKTAFLPLVPTLGVLLLIHEFKNLGAFPAALMAFLTSNDHRTRYLTLLILVGLGLNLQLFAGNYLRYGNLAPTMSDVISQEAAMQYRIGARETIFSKYSEGKISYMDALMKASEIKHPGDRSDTYFLLMNYEKLKMNPGMWMNFPQYAKFWFENVVGSIIGIKAHQLMFKDTRYSMPVYVIMTLALLGFLIRWRPGGETGWLPLLMASVVCGYAGFLMYRVNYQAYLYYGAPGITLQGRYLFPVIVPFSVLTCHYLVSLFRTNAIRIALTLATALLFIFYDFPWFLMHATPEWFTWPPG